MPADDSCLVCGAQIYVNACSFVLVLYQTQAVSLTLEASLLPPLLQYSSISSVASCLLSLSPVP